MPEYRNGPRRMFFETREQVTYDPLEYEGGATEAKKARDKEYRRAIDDGLQANRWTNRGQLRKYSGFGEPDGRVRDIYVLDIFDAKTDRDGQYTGGQL